MLSGTSELTNPYEDAALISGFISHPTDFGAPQHSFVVVLSRNLDVNIRLCARIRVVCSSNHLEMPDNRASG
jgi:hypothetical protein